MSKSLGNVIAPQEVLKRYGADILRLWAAGCDYAEDVRLSPEILEQVAEQYRKIRNTLRFLLGNLADFDPARDPVPADRMELVDRWAVRRAGAVVAEATAAYDAYEFHKAVRAVSQFCTVDLSNFYLDILKDRLYTWPTGAPARRSAQTALWQCGEGLVRVLAPLLPFTAEEVWEAMGRGREGSSVHLAEWPSAASPADGPDPAWPRFFQLRDLVLKALEQQRGAGVIGDSSEACVRVTVHDPAWGSAVAPLRAALAELLAVSMAEVQDGPGEGPVSVEVRHAPGRKCERCWRYTLDVGQAAAQPGVCARCGEALMSNPQGSR